LDCALDLSSCALVCRQWLDIVNNHRAIEISIVYDCIDAHPAFNQCLRRFKKVGFLESSSVALSATDVEVLCHQAKQVSFDCCVFTNLEAMKELLLACGNLSRLELRYPTVEDFEMSPVNDERVVGSPNMKIETLALWLGSNVVPEWKILEMFHNAAIDVVNVELHVNNNYGLQELRPIFCVLEEHYQNKVRELDVYEGTADEGFDRPLFKFYADFPRLNLKLKKLTTYFFEPENPWTSQFITSQPEITELDLSLNSVEVLNCALRHLPMLAVLKLDWCGHDELEVLKTNIQFMRSLTCLDITFDYDYCDPACDITFISKLPNLRVFSCQFAQPPSIIKFGPIENPMLQMKEFHFKCFSRKFKIDIDSESMWNIFNQMPNLEELTFFKESAKVFHCHLGVIICNIIELYFQPCQFGPLNALTKLIITTALIPNDEAIQNMILPNLRYLTLWHHERVTCVRFLTPLVVYHGD
jgi:hypothetical protein